MRAAGPGAFRSESQGASRPASPYRRNVTTCQVPGDSCPQCAQADLRPYGNGSKWICPRCYFILPCCEGGEVLPAAAGLRPTAAGPHAS